jgi:hypothetical protein
MVGCLAGYITIVPARNYDFLLHYIVVTSSGSSSVSVLFAHCRVLFVSSFDKVSFPRAGNNGVPMFV